MPYVVLLFLFFVSGCAFEGRTDLHVQPDCTHWSCYTTVHPACKRMDIETFSALRIAHDVGWGDPKEIEHMRRVYMDARLACAGPHASDETVSRFKAQMSVIQGRLGVLNGDIHPMCAPLVAILRVSARADLVHEMTLSDFYSDPLQLYVDGMNYCTVGWAGENAYAGQELLRRADVAYQRYWIDQTHHPVRSSYEALPD